MSVSSGGAESSSSREVDFLDLCTSNVRIVEDLAKGESLLNRRQCQDLSSKLSQTVGNIREVVSHSGASPTLFRPALTNLYRYLEKAKLLVTNCAEDDWCAAAVFQCQSENAFPVILLEVGLCYNAIYELAKSHSKERNDLPADLRQSPVFDPATDINVLEDKEDLQKRLDELASGDKNLKVVDHWIPGRAARRPSLAKYLLDKMHCTSLQPQASSLGSYSPVLWRKASEPSGTWGSSRFLGAGSGANGVCSTTWLGIPCAKKEFHEIEFESSFLKEAGILVHLKHPNIVDFICCGNGLQKGDRFIAMELMDMSLFDLIQKHKEKCEHFSIPVAVDLMVQVARGVCYLHSQGIAHRDLKPQNVVVSQMNTQQLVDQYCVKLVDFGGSKVEVEASKSNTMTACGTGTTMYRAPEVHPMANPNAKGIGKVNWLKADAFSFAMTCAHLLSLETPFQDLRPSELYNKVIKDGVRPIVHQMYPEDLVVLLKDCWETNPRVRPSFVDICMRLERIQHKYLRAHMELDKGLKEDLIDTSEGFDFIKRRLESPIKNQVGSEVEVIFLSYLLFINSLKMLLG
jgi:serine/threonine protein kinase